MPSVKKQNGCVNWIKQHQPISVTGTVPHSLKFLKALFITPKLEYPNSHFKPQGNYVTIYCIHATADTVAGFSAFATRLNNRLPNFVDRIVIVKFNKRFRNLGIEGFSDQLKQKISNDKSRNVVLMGHSRGGLVAAYFSENMAHEISAKVHLIVTFGTPFRGTSAANTFSCLFPASSSVAQMKPNSEFLSELNERILQEPLIPYHHFAAENDSIVSIESSLRSEDKIDRDNPPPNTTLYDRHGHLSMMSSHRAVEKVAGFMNDLNVDDFEESETKSLNSSINANPSTSKCGTVIAALSTTLGVAGIAFSTWAALASSAAITHAASYIALIGILAASWQIVLAVSVTLAVVGLGYLVYNNRQTLFSCFECNTKAEIKDDTHHYAAMI